VPFENNFAERMIRPAVIIRKNSLSNRSENGAAAQSMLMSVYRTLKLRGRDPIATVAAALKIYVQTGTLPPLPKVIVAAQEDGKGIGRIRMGCIEDLTRKTLHGFIAQSIEPGSVVVTDGLPAYGGLKSYRHEPIVISGSGQTASELLPRVHRVVSLLKRWLLGTHQGAIGHEHLNDYLDEYAFRFNRRKSASRGKLFYRLVQQAVQVEPAPYRTITHPHLRGWLSDVDTRHYQ